MNTDHPLLQKSLELAALHRQDNVAALSLKLAGRTDVDVPFVLNQIQGYQRMRLKVPRWARTEGILYPRHLSVEQCSSQATALYKQQLVSTLLPDPAMRQSMADLTGGLGVDFSFMAPLFAESYYVERQEELCRLAAHNFPLLGLEGSHIRVGDGLSFLTGEARGQQPFSLLFADPARRSATGRKVVALADCEPDLTRCLPLLLERTACLLLKLSPMLDISQAATQLPGTQQVHILSVDGECKELLLVVGREPAADLQYTCHGSRFHFSFSASEEQQAALQLADAPGAYLYEPDAAVMKSGAFKTLCSRFGVRALHPNSHLYTSEVWRPDFPGRGFAVEEVCGFSKHDLRRMRSLTDRANLAVRNFPMRVPDLRKKLGLREGGDYYLFATTLRRGEKALIVTRKTDGTRTSADTSTSVEGTV